MHRWYWEAQKEVSELMGLVEHAADGQRMQLVGRLQWQDEIDAEA
jgi:hypothetical protein